MLRNGEGADRDQNAERDLMCRAAHLRVWPIILMTVSLIVTVPAQRSSSAVSPRRRGGGAPFPVKDAANRAR